MKAINHFVLLIGLALIHASCANQNSQPAEASEEIPKEANSASVKKVTQTSPQASDPDATKLFRTPSDDISLPTDAQIAEGTETSQVQPPVEPNEAQPSISIKPPSGPASAGKP